MLTKTQLNKIIFINIETVPQYAKFADVPLNLQVLFLKKHDKEYTERTWTLRGNESGEVRRGKHRAPRTTRCGKGPRR